MVEAQIVRKKLLKNKFLEKLFSTKRELEIEYLQVNDSLKVGEKIEVIKQELKTIIDKKKYKKNNNFHGKLTKAKSMLENENILYFGLLRKAILKENYRRK